MRVNILGTYVDNVTMQEALEKVEKYILERKNRHIITLNAEIIYRAQHEAKLKELINRADLVTPDGAGVVWASRKLGTPLAERVTGIDLMQELVKKAAGKGWEIYLYGAAPGTAELAAANLKKKYEHLKIVGTKHGYLSSDEMPELLADIKARRPDIIFVALGAPRQEYWIAAHLDEINVPVAIGVGGSFDVLAGKVKRAPEIFRKMKLEWLYRLLKEPSRLGRMTALPKFIYKIMQESKKN